MSNQVLGLREEQVGKQEVTSETTPHTICFVYLLIVICKGLATEWGLRTGFGEGFLGTLAALQLDVLRALKPSDC